MDSNHHELYQRIHAYSLDDAQSQFTFTDRLARENGWDYFFARRVVDEYKRFMFLAVAAGHPVTPSEHIDQAWHLHLIYTRSYWDEFCGQVLGQPIHHGPTKGGSQEQDKYHDWYERTKASYALLFNESPPTDIWPESAERFGEDLECVRVNTHRNWVIPKPRNKTLSLVALAALTVLAITTVRILMGVLRSNDSFEDVEVSQSPMLTSIASDGVFQTARLGHMANFQIESGGVVAVVFGSVIAVIAILSALFGNKCAKCGHVRAMKRTGSSQRGVGFFAGTKYEWKCRYCGAAVWRAGSSSGGAAGCGSGCSSGDSCGDGGCGGAGCGGGCGGGGCGGGGD